MTYRTEDLIQALDLFKPLQKFEKSLTLCQCGTKLGSRSWYSLEGHALLRRALGPVSTLYRCRLNLNSSNTGCTSLRCMNCFDDERYLIDLDTFPYKLCFRFVLLLTATLFFKKASHPKLSAKKWGKLSATVRSESSLT